MTTKREELKLRVSYEPNRFSTIHLTDAYEVLVPTIHKSVRTNTETHHQLIDEPILDLEGEIS